MKNKTLGQDYLDRARLRVKALDVLYDGKGWADVVREAQEVVELTLKGLLRLCNISPPRVHDVSEVLEAEKDRLPKVLHQSINQIIKISRSMRRDRELAFYGTEDLTPSEFYKENDAKEARENAQWIVMTVEKAVKQL